jgi:hypothetical protein
MVWSERVKGHQRYRPVAPANPIAVEYALWSGQAKNRSFRSLDAARAFAETLSPKHVRRICIFIGNKLVETR